MIVVGGTYFEHCNNPPKSALRLNLIGSGLRAAAILRSVAKDLQLVTAIDERSEEEASLVCGGLALDVRFTRRSSPIGFHYFTPLSSPLVDGRLSRLDEPLRANDEAVLVYGMIESGSGASPEVRARSLVIDPQQPRDLEGLSLGTMKWERLAIVANAAETRALGGTRDVVEAAKVLLKAISADVVVTKRGARGVLVTTSDGQVEVGAIPTNAVWPIGSGDVFAAAFAWAWAEEDLPAAMAAHIASSATSAWVETGSLELTPDAFHDRTADELLAGDGTVYLAAPFFTLGERWHVELVRGTVLGLGAEVFSPLHDVGHGDTEVAMKDIEGLQAATAMLGLLDGADPGTVFEAGFATREGLPIVCYAESAERESAKMMVGTGAELHSDLSTAVYRAAWAGMGMALRTNAPGSA